jgi:uncharacterized iron-regulated protein
MPAAPIAASPRIFDVHAGRFIDLPTLVARIAPVRYRLLGEIHDNPAHHRLRAGLMTAIAATGRRPAAVFEQFDLGHDAALAAAQAAGADAEALAAAGALDKRGWRWPLHKPLIEAALAAGLPIHAGNAPTAALRPVMEGIDTSTTGSPEAANSARPGVTQAQNDHSSRIDPAWRSRLAHADWTDAQEAALRADIVAGHCNRLPARLVPHFALAQRRRDAAMAQALVDDATEDGAILIAGDGHVRRDLGVPVYLPSADVVSVGFVEVSAGDTRAAGFPRSAVADHPGFDYLWFTDAVSRADPCASLKMPKRHVDGDPRMP